MSSVSFSGLRARLHATGPLFLAQTMFTDPAAASILGGCGFDFVMVDAEHAPFTLESLRACIEALRAATTFSVIRIASQDAREIKQVLDLGADGVMIPRVESSQEAVSVIRAARYPPEGVRGVSRAVRASRFGADENYVQTANAHIAVIAIIESARGLQNVEDIVRTPGLDGIMVGGDDLSAELEFNNQKMVEAVESIMAAAMSAGLKVCGRAPRTKTEPQSMLIHCGNDAMVLRSAFQRLLDEQRGVTARAQARS